MTPYLPEQVLPDPSNMLTPIMASRMSGGNPLAALYAQNTPPTGANPLAFGPTGDYPMGTPETPNSDYMMGVWGQGGSLPDIPAADGRYANMTEGARAAWGRLLQMRPDLADYLTSTYRDPEHNKRVGGANNSQHIHGNAFDMSIPGLSQEDTIALIEDAKRAGFAGIGVYGPGTVHFDVGPARAWGPSYGADSIPDWARPYVY